MPRSRIARARAPLLVLLATACGVAIDSDPFAKPTAAEAAGMNGAEARAVLTKMLEKYDQGRLLRLSPVGVHAGLEGNVRRYRFVELPDPNVWRSSRGFFVEFAPAERFFVEKRTKQVDPQLEADARAVARAFYVLKHGGGPEAWARTVAEVREGRRSVEELPEEARRFKVQADAAIRDRRLADASLCYFDALEFAPWWAAGHFNRGLILGELGYYPEARAELAKYLELLPEAPDARQAKDKIYEWEAKK